MQIRDLSPVTVGRSWNPDISNNRSLPFQISKHSRQTILRLRLCLRRRRRLYSLSDKACILVQNYFNRFPRMKSVIVCFCTISYTSPSFILLPPPSSSPSSCIMCPLTDICRIPKNNFPNNSMKTLYPQPQLLVVFNFVHKLVKKKEKRKIQSIEIPWMKRRLKSHRRSQCTKLIIASKPWTESTTACFILLFNDSADSIQSSVKYSMVEWCDVMHHSLISVRTHFY